MFESRELSWRRSEAGRTNGNGVRPCFGLYGPPAMAGVFALALLSACAVGPDFKAPPAPPDAGYAPEAHPAATAAVDVAGGASQKFDLGRDIPAEWWKVFHSRELDSLITQALQANPSLQAAQAALWQAKENLYAQRGKLLPTVDANSSATREQVSLATFGEPGPPLLFNLFQTTVNVGYVPDVFGGQRRQVEANAAATEYQRFEVEATYLTLTANVATAAIAEASLRDQITATLDIIRVESQQLDVVRHQFEVGAATRTDVLTQQSEGATAQATLPPLQKQLEQQRHVLLALTGRFPNQTWGDHLTLASLRLPTDLPLSLPSQLVEQRPDVRQYSALLHQATAQIGVATANMLPQLTLTGSYGGEATKFSNVFDPSSVVWSLIGGVTQPLFKGGALVHQRRAAVAAAQIAAANYRATVITAFQNVSNTLYALQADADALGAETVAERSAAESLTLVQAQYKSGGASYLQVLTAEQTYQTAAVNLVKAFQWNFVAR